MFLNLIRGKQYYKNLLVFLVLIFAGEALNLSSLNLVAWGFVSLCLISSTNYILNDIFDLKRDRVHPEKRKRAIVSGKVSVFWASVVAIIFAIIALVIAFFVSYGFFILVIGFFLFTQIYSLYLKNQIFLDIIAIAINFVIRAVSGAFILDVRVSPWLIVCAFFLSLFLVTAKRKGDLVFLGVKAKEHKRVLQFYSVGLLDKMLIIIVTLLIASYSFYSFSSVYPMLITLPVVLYAVLRYLYLLETKSEIVRKPELFLRDSGLLISSWIWIFLCVFLIYIFPLIT
jgi:4-hydroxybenzoate polyprenyltransferase